MAPSGLQGHFFLWKKYYWQFGCEKWENVLICVNK